MPQQAVISASQAWLNNFVIDYNICPFARREQEKNSIRYLVLEGDDTEQHLEALIVEAEHLDNHPTSETSLLIFSDGYQDFDDFLDLIAIADDLMIEQGYDGVYQLASFHPDYCFADSQPDDAANYTNRSPYPMLHIIREESIEKALAKYPNPEQIPERNIQLTHKLGLEKLQTLLANCHTSNNR
ncbi:MAG: hypothetical protein RLZ92_1078 [Pseudomonadota bacterium]|jgi:hypothetical protein